MSVRIISWNIFNFAAGKNGIMSRTDSIDRVLEVVHPSAAGADPECDIFVIIEPVTNKGKVGAPAVGGGPSGGTQILGMLQGRHNGAQWRLVDPLCIYSSTKGEAVLVFYCSLVVTVKGAPALLSNVPTAVMPNWRINSARESCPFHVTFSMVAGGADFELIAQHAPSPTYGKKKNKKANEGVKAVGTHAKVTAWSKLVYLGDLNLCGVAVTDTACHKQGHAEDRTTLANLGMTLVAGGVRSSLKSSKAKLGNYREHAYDNILAKGHTAPATGAGVIDLVDDVLNEHLVSKPGPIPAATFKRLFNKVRIGKNKGISDHLPVKVTLTF